MKKNVISIAIIIGCANSLRAMDEQNQLSNSTAHMSWGVGTSQLNDINRSTIDPQEWGVVSNQPPVISQQRFSDSSLHIKELPVGEFVYDRGYVGTALDKLPANDVKKTLQELKRAYEAWDSELPQKIIEQTEYDKQMLSFALESFEEGACIDAFEQLKAREKIRIESDQRPVLCDLYEAYLRKELSTSLEPRKKQIIAEEVTKELANNNSPFFGPIKDKVKLEMLECLANGKLNEVALDDTAKHKQFNNRIQQLKKRVPPAVIGAGLLGFACGVLTRIIITKKSS